MIDQCPKHKCVLIKVMIDGQLTPHCSVCRSERPGKEEVLPDIGKQPHQVYQKLDESKPNSQIRKYRPGHYTQGHRFDLDKINDYFKAWDADCLKLELERIVPREKFPGEATFKIYFWERCNRDLDFTLLDYMDIGCGTTCGNNDLKKMIDTTISFMIDRIINKAYKLYE